MSTDSKQIHRRNRNAAIRGAMPNPPATVARHAKAASDAAPAPGSLEAVLASRHRWLRFPAAMEARFHADNEPSRRQFLIICTLIGILGFWLGSSNDKALMPDLLWLVPTLNVAYVVCALAGLVVTAWLPKPWRRHWHLDAMTAVNTVVIGAQITAEGALSQADTTFTHMSCMIGVLMYTCIAARLRFRWSFGVCVLSYAGFVMFVRGTTPLQTLIVWDNIRLLTVSLFFTLLANYAFEHRERRNWLLRQLEQKQQAMLAETSRHMHALSIRDALTGLFNRRQFDRELDKAWSHAAATRQPLSLLMLDADFFKRYNDTYGHPAGDACLKRIADETSRLATERGGVAGRLGGEEFGLLLAGHTRAQGLQVAQTLCRAVTAAGMEHAGSAVSPHVSVSVGVATALPHQGGSRVLLMDEADRALYQAKERGRNRAWAGAAVPAPPGNPPNALRSDAPEPVAASSSDVGEYENALQGGFPWLLFPARVETVYQRGNESARRRRLLSASLLGLLIFDLYTFSGRAMFPDIHGQVLGWLILVNGVVLLGSCVSYGLRMPTLWRDALYAIGASLLGCLSAFVLAQSHQLTALSFSVCFFLMVLFSAVGTRLPFWFTCLTSVVTVASMCVAFKPAGAQQSLVLADTLFTVANSALYALIAAYTLERGARKEWLLSQIAKRQFDALAEANQRLRRLSIQDPLTGLSNRRHFEEDIQRLCNQARDGGEPLAMLVIDVDFFKRFNDGYGHPAGDRCLQQVAKTLLRVALGSRGLASRLGGEEFCILLPGHTLAQALKIGERACAEVRDAKIPHAYSDVAPWVTVSVGVSCQPSVSGPSQSSASSLLAEADDALYKAKAQGRNRAVGVVDVPDGLTAQALLGA